MSPHIRMLKPLPQCDGIWRWGLGEVISLDEVIKVGSLVDPQEKSSLSLALTLTLALSSSPWECTMERLCEHRMRRQSPVI